MFLRLPESAAISGTHKLGSRWICRQAKWSVGKMTSQARQVRRARMADRRMVGNEQVRREIQSFLHALKSYPDRFAKEPHITFAEHHCGLARAANEEPRRRI
jgi:hypothetical protein